MKKRIRTATTLLVVLWLPLVIWAQTPSSIQQPVATGQGSDYLTLDSATEQFLRKNLIVEAARLELGVAEAERVGARLRPRPGLTVSAENLRLSGQTPASNLYEFGASVAQPIEMGNRKTVRMEVAERTVAVSEAQLTQVLRRQLFDLKRTYYESVLASAILDIEKENRDNFEGLLRFNKTRFEEGYIAEGDLIKVRLERIKFDFSVATAALAFRKTKIRLLELVGDADYERAARMEVRSNFDVPNVKIDLAQLKEIALNNRPEIKVAEAEMARAEAVLKLERSEAKGEVTPYVGYKRVGVDNTILAGVTVPLPFGNRNQSGIARAEAEQRIAETKLRFARNHALAEVESAFHAYETAREQIRAYEGGLLKQADESRDIQFDAYQEGATELITLIEAQRTRTEVRANYYRSIFDFYSSIFQLELATGSDIRL
ncbi:MAG TPA: TolC family protein [Pyrinomonadaceae bacterium]|nr:TolC family protein [Pyrinomonadaceae bacterium]